MLREREIIKAMLAVYDSLNANDKLWNPKDLSGALLINDPDMSTEKIMSYIDRFMGRSGN